MIDGKKYKYYHHIVTEDGKIYNPIEKEMKINKKGMIKVTIDGKKHVYVAGRIVYEAISGVPMTDPRKVGNTSRKKILLFKDGDCTNTAFENLIAIDRTEYFADKEWSTRKFSDEVKRAICKDFFKEGDEHVTLRNLAKKYNCSVSFVQNVINKERMLREKDLT